MLNLKEVGCPKDCEYRGKDMYGEPAEACFRPFLKIGHCKLMARWWRKTLSKKLYSFPGEEK